MNRDLKYAGLMLVFFLGFTIPNHVVAFLYGIVFCFTFLAAIAEDV